MPAGAPDRGRAQKLLLQIFAQLGEPDSIYALAQTGDLSTQTKVRMHEGEWSRALQGLDLQLRAPPAEAGGADSGAGRAEEELYADLATCLKGLGCSHLLWNYLQAPAAQACAARGSKALRSVQYEAAWRLGNWDLPNEDAAEAPFHQTVHYCLGAVVAAKTGGLAAVLERLQRTVVDAISARALETCSTVHAFITKWRLIQGLEACLEAVAPGPGSGGGLDFAVTPTQLRMEQYTSEYLSEHYALVEPLVALQTAFLRSSSAAAAGLRYRSHLLVATRAALQAGRLQDAAGALQALRGVAPGVTGAGGGALATAVSVQHHQMLAMDAELLWAQGQRGLAVQQVRSLVAALDAAVQGRRATDAELGRLHVQSSIRLAAWLSEEGSAALEEIRASLRAAVDAAKTGQPGSAPLRSEASFTFAQFADRQLGHILRQERSPEWQQRKLLLETRDSILQTTVPKSSARNQGDMAAMAMYKHQMAKDQELDTKDVQAVELYKEECLANAIRHYAVCLAHGDAHDLQAVCRLSRLWFQFRGTFEVNNLMESLLPRIRSAKFLMLIPQMASQISEATGGAADDKTKFHAVLNQFLERAARDHPFHVLYKLLALKNSRDGSGHSSRRKGVKPAYEADREKVAAASSLVRKVQKADRGRLAPIVDELTTAVSVYLALANVPVKAGQGRKVVAPAMPREVRAYRPQEAIPIVSRTLPVREPGEYFTAGRGGKAELAADIVALTGFDAKIEMVGGITHPKCIKVRGSDGRAYRELVKSGDDLRQDATMEQLFGLANRLLCSAPASRRRDLKIATYNIVPFNPTAGVVEWVDGCQVLSDYLWGPKSGGKRTHVKCMNVVWEAQEDSKNLDLAAMREAYLKACELSPPSLHRFFLENYYEPAVWYERQLAFTRSVAVSSIVGHVLGLGDRHLGNILIQQRTAQVVHIDLGIAFEQGRILKIPERVPFRLTRELVDGMGVCGVEGPMRQSCEATMEVLRAHKNTLLTLLEVFVHDPLYNWSLTAVKLLQVQLMADARLEEQLGGVSEDTAEDLILNSDANRVLQQVQRKLEGKEREGGGQVASVKGQVQQLLQEARSTDNLCQMYVGWASWR